MVAYGEQADMAGYPCHFSLDGFEQAAAVIGFESQLGGPEHVSLVPQPRDPTQSTYQFVRQNSFPYHPDKPMTPLLAPTKLAHAGALDRPTIWFPRDLASETARAMMTAAEILPTLPDYQKAPGIYELADDQKRIDKAADALIRIALNL